MKEKKKLLIYVNSMNAYGGIERVISILSNNLIKYIDITILVKDKPISAYKLNNKIGFVSLENELILNMTSRIQRIVSIYCNIFSSIRKLKIFFKNNSYDYIYTALPTNGIEIYFSNKANRKKIIASEHASYYAYNSVYKLIKKWLYPKLSVISVPTTMDTDIYKKLGYNAFYIPHMSTFNTIHKNKLNNKVAINVGRLTDDKQQALLLEIWKKVNDTHPDNDWILRIIGSGENEQVLKNKILNEKIKNVEMIPHTSNIKDYYENSSLFLFTSRMEGFGMVLLEAMSFGVPCISFDCPSGPRDIIKNEYNGYLISCYNIDDYVTQLINYLDLPKYKRNLLSKNANETVKNWDNYKISLMWLDLFRIIDNKIK